VPQLTCGASAVTSRSTVRSNCAPSSECSACHDSTARLQSSPRGASGRPRTYSMVRASTATRPARAPASIAMLHRVMRASTELARIVGPANSIV